MSSDLFRKEAIRHRTRALFGDVVLAVPLSNWLLSFFVIGVFITFLLLGLFFDVSVELNNGDTDTVPLWRWLLHRS